MMMVMMHKWVMKQLLCYWRELCAWRSCRREFYFSKAGREMSISHYVPEIVNGCHRYRQVNVQQYAAFETSTLVNLFTQRSESQELNQGTPLSPLLLLLASQVFAVIIVLFSLSAHCRMVFSDSDEKCIYLMRQHFLFICQNLRPSQLRQIKKKKILYGHRAVESFPHCVVELLCLHWYHTGNRADLMQLNRCTAA